MEVVDARKFGTRRAENPARVAVCETARGSLSSKLRTGRWGVTSVVTHVVNARGSNPGATLPFVRDVLDGHLLSPAKGTNITRPLFIHVQGVHSMDALFPRAVALPVSQPAPFRCAHNCALGSTAHSGPPQRASFQEGAKLIDPAKLFDAVTDWLKVEISS